MRTGEMKYVILRIDTHVLRIDLCPRKRTRIRRQKQDEDVHLFLSERKKARASADGPCRGREAGRIPECTYHGRGGRLRTPANLAWYPKGPECTYHGRGVSHTPPKRAARPEWDVPGRAVGPVDHSPGRNPGRRNPGAKRHTPPKRAPGPEWMDAGYVYSPRAGGAEGDVPGPPRVSPWAMIRRPYRAHGYPGTCIRHRWWRPVGRIQYAPTRVPTPTNQRAARPQHLNGPQAPTNQHQPGL